MTDYRKVYLDFNNTYDTIHHIDLNHNNNDYNNLISLSFDTHSRLHKYIEVKRALNIIELKIENTIEKNIKISKTKTEKELIKVLLTDFNFVVPKVGTTFKKDLLVVENPKEDLNFLKKEQEKLQSQLNSFNGLRGELTIAIIKKKEGKRDIETPCHTQSIGGI